MGPSEVIHTLPTTNLDILRRMQDPKDPSGLSPRDRLHLKLELGGDEARVRAETAVPDGEARPTSANRRSRSRWSMARTGAALAALFLRTAGLR